MIRGLDRPRFFPDNSTCQFCDSIKFVIFEKQPVGEVKEVILAETPDEWLASLKSRGVIGFRLGRTAGNNPEFPDRMSAAFVGGGGTWEVEVLFAGGMSEFWASRWLVWNQNAPERRIWRVNYGLMQTAETRPLTLRSIGDVRSDLQRALTEIHKFSVQQNYGGFMQFFAKALESLDQPEMESLSYWDLFIPGLMPDEAAAVLKAVTHAWVFGGMGSWNDMGFAGEIQKEYERVSENLFQVLNEAIVVAATSSFPQKAKGL